MSWDVLLFKHRFDLEADEEPAPLGERASVVATLTALLPAIDYSDNSWGILEEEDYSIEFNTGDESTTGTIMLHIRGEGAPMAVIKLICDATGWAALDTSEGSFLDTTDLSPESWQKFQQYRDKIIGRTGE